MARVTGEGAKRAFLTIDAVIRALSENSAHYTRQELVCVTRAALAHVSRASEEPQRDTCTCGVARDSVMTAISSCVQNSIRERS